MCTILSNVLILGESLTQLLYFPTYTGTKLLNIGMFLVRIEEIVACIIMCSCLMKVVVCLQVASGTIGTLVNSRARDGFIVPAGMLMLALTLFLARNVQELLVLKERFAWPAALLGVLLPVAVWLLLEWRKKHLRA